MWCRKGTSPVCGRYTLYHSTDQIMKRFGITRVFDQIPARYNVAPTNSMPVVVQRADERELHLCKWGLIPPWAKDKKIAYNTINAIGETVADKPAFRSAFKTKRCLVVADGYYEWLTVGTRKLPVYFHLRSNEVFAFAGLYEQWRDPETKTTVPTFTILTTTPNELGAKVHSRMPAILKPEEYDFWLNPELTTFEQLGPLLRPYPADEMEAYDVRPLVNKVGTEGPELITPLPLEPEPVAVADNLFGD